jgi:hypothetical protein
MYTNLPFVPGTLISITQMVMLHVVEHPYLLVAVTVKVEVPWPVGVKTGAPTEALLRPVAGNQE